jgi:hypothetical protein
LPFFQGITKKIKKEHKGSTKKNKIMPLQSFQEPERSLPANRLIKASQGNKINNMVSSGLTLALKMEKDL